MFESQHDWFEHEVNFHRKLWQCKLCNDRLSRSKPKLNSHLQDHHAGTNEAINPQNVKSWQKPRIDATECPLCCTFATKLKAANNSQKCDVTLKQFQSHLGVHFEQLAFAALPNGMEDEAQVLEDLSSDDGDDGDNVKERALTFASAPTASDFIVSDDVERSVLVVQEPELADNIEEEAKEMDDIGKSTNEQNETEERSAQWMKMEVAMEAAMLAKVKKEAAEEAKKPREEHDKVKTEAAEALAKTLSPPNGDKRKPIKFKDAVGRKFSFPFELCATWEVSTIYFILRILSIYN